MRNRLNTLRTVTARTALVLSLGLAAISVASAGIVQVSSPGALGSGPFTVDTFESGGSGVASYSAVDGVQQASAADFVSGVTPSGDYGLTGNGFPASITITFPSAVGALGLWFGNDDTCCSSQFTANLDLYNGATLVTTISEIANMNDFADQFIGAYGDAGETFTHAVIRFGSGSNVFLYTYIDDVTFGEASSGAAPEPSTSLLFGSGLVGAAAWIRRRRRV